MRVLPFGDAALLVEVDGLPEVLALTAAVRDAQPAGVVDVVPAAQTVLVVVEPGTSLAQLERTVAELSTTALAGSVAAPEGETVDIPVVYDGPDLAEVARLTGLGEDEVVAANPLAAYHDKYDWAFITTENMTRTLYRDWRAAR